MDATTITMIDYGASNIRSAQKAFEHVGATVILTEDPDVVRRADRLVLPGVGAFGAGMAGLQRRELPSAIREAVARGVPFLGICVGMQLMFDDSEELGHHAGLGLLPGHVRLFPGQLTAADAAGRPLKVPHMGWNQLQPAWGSRLLAGVPAGAYAYFVHSYYCDPEDATAVVAWTDYGLPFAAVVARDNLFGLQFHPEKSQQVGLRILQNFVEMT